MSFRRSRAILSGRDRLPRPGQLDDKVFIDYKPMASGTGYIPSAVMLEFGARSTGEPSELRPVLCDATMHLEDMEFPEAMPQVMRAERTFWEEATAIHVFCAQGAFRGGDRFARYWTTQPSWMPLVFPMRRLPTRH